jgi:hypothetical protein
VAQLKAQFAPLRAACAPRRGSKFYSPPVLVRSVTACTDFAAWNFASYLEMSRFLQNEPFIHLITKIKRNCSITKCVLITKNYKTENGLRRHIHFNLFPFLFYILRRWSFAFFSLLRFFIGLFSIQFRFYLQQFPTTSSFLATQSYIAASTSPQMQFPFIWHPI